MFNFSVIILTVFLICNNSFSEIRSLKNNQVNVRIGPSKNYPIKFIYKNKYLPVNIIDKHYNWRKIKDYENDEGWIHVSQLSRSRTTITTLDNKVVFSSPSIFSRPKAKLEIHQILIIKECNELWCKVKNSKINGWIKKDSLWGVKKDEIIKK